jgi:hypothetical protein
MFGLRDQCSKHGNCGWIRLLQPPINGTKGGGHRTVMVGLVGIAARLYVFGECTEGNINIDQKVFSFQNSAFLRMVRVAVSSE